MLLVFLKNTASFTFKRLLNFSDFFDVEINYRRSVFKEYRFQYCVLTIRYRKYINESQYQIGTRARNCKNRVFSKTPL